MRSVSVVTPPAEEPLTLAEAKLYLRVDHTADDTLIPNLITAARLHAENYLSRALITQTIDVRYDYFTYTLQLPRGTVQSVSSVKYIDTDGVEQTLSASLYKVDEHSVPARLVPAYGEVWPTARYEINAVTVRAIVGYGNAAAVPDAIKQALYLHIAHMYENREAASPVALSDTPMGYVALMSTYRLPHFE